MLGGKIVATVAGVVGTILVVNLLDKLEYGEAIDAFLIVYSVSQITTLGIGQFIVVKARDRRDLAFHATAIHLTLGVVALISVWVFREPLDELVGAPGMGRFVAWMGLAMMIDRISLVPERVLMRNMQFRVVAIARTFGEFAYIGVSISLAYVGWGGMAIVIGNVVRSAIRASLMIRSTDRRDWLEPTKLRLASVLEMFRFSGPIWIAALASFAGRRWDNLLVSGFYGAGTMGDYNIAYNLAENPPVVTEQAIDVLLPSFSRLDAGQRVAGLIRSLSLMSFITSPLVIGLGAIAPSLVEALFAAERADVAPMLAVLSAMSVTRPLTWTCTAYFQATDRPRIVMGLEVMNIVVLLSAIAIAAQSSVIWVCVAVGIASALRALVTALVLRKVERIGLWQFLEPQLRPVLATLPMVGWVLAVRYGVAQAGVAPVVRLLLEIAAGGLGYVAGAWVFAHATFRDALDLIRRALNRRREAA